MNNMDGQPSDPWAYSVDWELVLTTIFTFLNNNAVVTVLPTILHFVGRPTFPFILGAVMFNTLVTSIRLAWRNGLYDDSVGAYYYEAIRPQRYYIVTRLALILVGAIIKLPFWVVWWYPGSVVGVLVFLVLAYKAQLLEPFTQRLALHRWFGYSNQAMLWTIWTIGILCNLLINLLSYALQILQLFVALPDRCLQAIRPRPALQHYQYHPIQPGSIRLLRVYRKYPLCDLKTSLIDTAIDTAPPYEAISYTWGTTSDTMDIIVDGQPFRISMATYNAIYGCSSMWRSRLFWIDYLCINQNDVTEKGEQVSQMIQVYEKAQQVIVYLGHFTWKSILPLSLFWEIFHHVEVEKNENWLYRRYEVEVILPRWKSLVEFFNHPWFSRVWILQEVAAAQNIVVYYGGLAFDWDTFMLFKDFFNPNKLAHLLQMPLHGRSAYNSVDNLRHINTLRLNRVSQRAVEIAIGGQNKALMALAARFTNREDLVPKWEELGQKVSRSTSLQMVLVQNAHFKATDPRDKIYALQGLTSSVIPPEIQPDYRKPVETLCIDVAKYFWLSSDPFMTIAWAGIGHERNLKLPSWATDWTTEIRGAPLSSPDYDDEASPHLTYAAAGGTAPQVSLDAIDEGYITFQGVFVDQIDSLARVCSTPDDKTDDYITDANGTVIYPHDFLEQRRWHNEVAEMALRNVPLQYLVPRTDALWRTLIGDITNTERPAPADLALTYATWVMGLEYMTNWFESRDKDSALPISDNFWNFLNVGAIWAPRAAMCSNERRFCLTKDGFMGQVLPNSQVGDIVCIAYGAKTPWILRPVVDEDSHGEDTVAQQRYQFVGECFMYGMMDGEMMDECAAQSFVLV